MTNPSVCSSNRCLYNCLLAIILVSFDVYALVNNNRLNFWKAEGLKSQYYNSTRQRNVASTYNNNWWKPKASDRLTWQYQLQNSQILDMRYNVDMYDVDLFTVTDKAIEALHASNRIVVCYFSAGTYESYRSDWSKYFSFIKPDTFYTGNQPPFAKPMDDWENERWLDIRRIDLLRPIMMERLQYAANRSCDAVEPDNMDAYTNNKESGLKLTASDQLAYNRFIATEAHKLGLSVGLKNDVDQLSDLVDDFDFAINEQCFYYNECAKYEVFTNKNKAVFGVEYSGNICRICSRAKRNNLSWMKKRLELNSWRQGCNDASIKRKCRL